MDDNPISIGTKIQYSRCINAIRDGKTNALGCFDEYCNVVIENLEFFRMDLSHKTVESPADEIFYKNVTSLLTVRDEILNIISAIMNYTPTSEFISKIHNFFERIYDYNNIPKTTSNYQLYDVENYEQFNYQLFLYTVALFIRYERFAELNTFLSHRFLVYDHHHCQKVNYFFSLFNCSKNRLIFARNNRLNLHKISLIGHYLREEWKHKTINHDEIIQAEIILFIFGEIKFNNEQPSYWFPHNIVYLDSNMIPDIFIKAESNTYLKKFALLLSIDDLRVFVQKEHRPVYFSDSTSYYINRLINLEKLGTLS